MRRLAKMPNFSIPAVQTLIDNTNIKGNLRKTVSNYRLMVKDIEK